MSGSGVEKRKICSEQTGDTNGKSPERSVAGQQYRRAPIRVLCTSVFHPFDHKTSPILKFCIRWQNAANFVVLRKDRTHASSTDRKVAHKPVTIVETNPSTGY